MMANESSDCGNMCRTIVLVGITVTVVAGLLEMSAGIGSRLGWWHFRTGFNLLRYGAYGGMAAIALGLAGGFMASRKRYPAMAALAILIVACGAAVVTIPTSFRLKAKQVPMIHDITTDTINPPEFVAILPLREGAPNPATYGGPGVADQQKRAYGDLRTEVLDLPFDKAFDRALAAAKDSGWHVVAVEPAAGRIEATDTTFWFGFTDDIVIRLAAAGPRTLLDIRSVSRVGKSDVGKNAERIRSYLKRVRQ